MARPVPRGHQAWSRRERGLPRRRTAGNGIAQAFEAALDEAGRGRNVRDHEARCDLAEAGARHGRLPARGRKADEHAEDDDNGAGEGNGPFHEATLEFGEPGVEVVFRRAAGTDHERHSVRPMAVADAGR